MERIDDKRHPVRPVVGLSKVLVKVECTLQRKVDPENFRRVDARSPTTGTSNDVICIFRVTEFRTLERQKIEIS